MTDVAKSSAPSCDNCNQGFQALHTIALDTGVKIDARLDAVSMLVHLWPDTPRWPSQWPAANVVSFVRDVAFGADMPDDLRVQAARILTHVR